jgi:hypothetical protein
MTELDAGGSTGETERRATVRIVQSVDPPAAASALLEEHEADRADDLTTAEREVRRRVEAGRRALVPAGADDEQLLLRAADIRAEASVDPPISDADVEELERLASDLARAARIRTRTEERFSATLQAKLAASSGVALHPGAIKEAGEAVVAAEAALVATEQALAALGPRPAGSATAAAGGATGDDGGGSTSASGMAAAGQWSGATGGGRDASADDEDPVLRRPHDVFDEAALDRRRATRLGSAVFLVLLGLGLIAGAAGLPIGLAVGLVAAGVLLAALIVLRGRRGADDRADTAARHAAESQSMLHSLGDAPGRPAAAAPTGPPSAPVATPGAAAPTEPPSHAATTPADEEWLDRWVALEGARDDADEELRVARRRWHQLAGPDADPHDIEGVVRVHDPQLAFDARVADASPTVRTVAAFHRKAQARWRVLWNAIGYDDPPPPETLDGLLEQLLGEHRRHQAELRRLEAAEARAAANVEARRPLVLVEPSTWVSSARLAQLLASVPPQGQVLVLEREGTHPG